MRNNRTLFVNVLLAGLALVVVLTVRTLTGKSNREAQEEFDSVAALVGSIEFAVKEGTQIEALERARPRVVEVLARQLDADDTQLKKLARDSWEKLPEEIRSRLGQMREPVELRRAAIWGLVLTFERTNATPAEADLLWRVLRGALWDPDTLVRANAAWLASVFDPSDARALELCKSAVTDQSFIVREAAAKSLGKLGASRADARELLEKMTQDTHAVVRDTAEIRLRFLRGKDRARALNQSVGGSEFE